MDGQPTEESHSIAPNQRRNTAESLPSQELLDEKLHYPQELAAYFNRVIDDQSEKTPQTARIIQEQLDTYKNNWLPHLAETYEVCRSIITASPETMPQKSGLAFHEINKHIMAQWKHVLISSLEFPRMSSRDLHTAQIKLAVESVLKMSAKTSLEQADFLENELRDFDGMIEMLQLSIDGKLYDEPTVVTVPHPKMADIHQQTSFLKFNLAPDGSFIKTEVPLSDILPENHIPGSLAVRALNTIRLNDIARRPEFQDKAEYTRFARAHWAARSIAQKQA